MYRLATVLALAILLVGCGDENEEASSTVGSEVAQSDRARNDEKKAETRPRKDSSSEEDSPPGDEVRDAEEEPVDPHEAQEEALEDASPEQRNTLIRIAAEGALTQFGLKLADLEITRGGRAVTVVVARETACKAVARDEPVMGNRVRGSAPMVKSVRFEVEGTGQELGYYVLSCKRDPIPNGPGTVVLKRTAVGGPVTTKRFRIRGDRWAIEWENGASSLAVIVIAVGGKAKGAYKDPVSSDERETGRQEYTGSGVYQLRIHGRALWTVRVKDIR